MSQGTETIMQIDRAERLKQLPPYLFVELDKAKQRLVAAGKDVIDLGVGDPDLPTPHRIIQRLQQTAEDPANHRYSFTEGLPQLRQAIAAWYLRRFHVTLNPDTEALPLLGSKEGIANLPLALLNPGDKALIPDPCYPPTRNGTILAGGEPVLMPLLEENQFLPDLGGISQKAAQAAKLMFLNYPNNPTAAVATEEFFQEAIQFAKDYNMIIAHDAAYTEIAYDGYRPISFLQLPGAKEIGVEFHSCSKTYQMTGWRVGFACGQTQVISALRQLKTNLDSGIFQPVQYAAIEALTGPQDDRADVLATYQERRDALLDGLAKVGWQIPKPKAAFYVWAKVPGDQPSIEFAKRALEEVQVIITPGDGFGVHGAGYVRMALTVPTPRIQEAVTRLAKIL